MFKQWTSYDFKINGSWCKIIQKSFCIHVLEFAFFIICYGNCSWRHRIKSFWTIFFSSFFSNISIIAFIISCNLIWSYESENIFWFFWHPSCWQMFSFIIILFLSCSNHRIRVGSKESFWKPSECSFSVQILIPFHILSIQPPSCFFQGR
ncbi:MAG: hypothetical protein ACD_3C00200G0001 [uncultured bacterium (gcode 4)]|uniref:Uncharacterized protein n=1 Tax=uncultured bacterium (gcode 4) TaxID=1234023 RepID=K2G006_9BACT|nr:MAG: hypothetical protein ACD_3C00200G0001 [uncultured bacterium (gcode 4)]